MRRQQSTMESSRVFRRWDTHQRLQHILLMTSFTTLVMTGLPLRFPKAGISRALMHIFSGVQHAGIVHRSAAVVLILTGTYHLVYLAGRFLKGRLSWSMIPRWKDVTDLFGMIAFFFGFRSDRPKFEKYNFGEKFEYWAVIWGSLVMIISGLVLWFPVKVARVLPMIVVDIAKVMHGYEALLAALAITIWHFYHAHLNPDYFPMNWTWITGTLTEEEMQHHHAAEYERKCKVDNGK